MISLQIRFLCQIPTARTYVKKNNEDHWSYYYPVIVRGQESQGIRLFGASVDLHTQLRTQMRTDLLPLPRTFGEKFKDIASNLPFLGLFFPQVNLKRVKAWDWVFGYDYLVVRNWEGSVDLDLCRFIRVSRPAGTRGQMRKWSKELRIFVEKG